MQNEVKIAPVIKTLARRITREEQNQVSGGWFNQNTYVTVPKESAEQENSFDTDGHSVGLDTIK